MHITVVIPTYNRAENLRLTLAALLGQTYKAFSVVVSDDGSTDHTAKVVDSYAKHLQIVSCRQNHDGYRVSKARNEGVKVARVAFNPSHVLFVDSDVMLNPRALEHYGWLIRKLSKNAVVCGKYDWLPPMNLTPERVLNDWDGIVKEWEAFVGCILTDNFHVVDVLKRWPGLPEREGIPFVGGNAGRDPRLLTRPDSWYNCLELRVARGATLSGNLLVPIPILDATGGFDEAIKDQGQDGEFSYNLWSKGYKATMCGHSYGLHVFHPRDPDKLLASAKRTIQYIHKKYNVPLKEVPSWWHRKDLENA